MIAGLHTKHRKTPLGMDAQRRFFWGEKTKSEGVVQVRIFLKPTFLAISLLFCLATPAYALDVTLQWDANTESDLAGYWIYYDTSPGNPYNGSGAQQGNSPIQMTLAQDLDPDPNVVEYTVYNLPAGTYYFAITAYNTGNLESGYSNEVNTSSSPPPDTTPPVVSNVQAASITSSTAMITWTTDEASDSEVQYDTVSRLWGNYLWGANDTNMVTSHSISLTGLNSSTTYHFRVGSIDGSGNGPTVSSELTFTTAAAPDTTPPYATNRSPAPGATNVSIDTLVTLELRDAGVGVDQSTITMSIDGSPVTPSVSGTPAAYTLSYNPTADFAYDQTVSVEVDASDLNGNAMATDSYSFTTAAPSDTSPPVISNVQVSPITDTNAVITWTTDEASNSLVEYGTSSSTWGSYAHSGNDGSEVTNHSITLTGLNPGTMYVFRIGSSDSSGNGPTTSDELSFTTDLSSGTISEVFGDVSGADYTGVSQDTFINSGQPTTNYSSDPSIRTYTWPTDAVANRTIVKWDLSAIPPTAIIKSATLSLFMYGYELTGGDAYYEISAHKILNHDPIVASCTWNTYDGVDSWTGGFDGGAQDLAISESTAVVDKTFGYKSWNVTQMIQQWVNGPSTNFGLMLNADSTAASNSNRYFNSTEHSSPDQRPKLTITYIPPPADTTAPVISNIQASSITDTTAVITWTTDELSDSEVQYGATAGSYPLSRNSTNLVTSHSVTLTGLNDDTTYYFRVGSSDGSGNGPTMSNELSFTTDPTPDTTAPNISNVQVTSITETTAIVSWTTNEPSDSEVQYDSVSRLWGSYPWGENDDTLVTSHSITLTGLEADTTYYFRVGSTDGSGNGPTTSTEMSFTTEAVPSPIPPNSPTGLNIIRAQ
jgi:hypothetical protein